MQLVHAEMHALAHMRIAFMIQQVALVVHHLFA
jgi:hypothetical protein